MKIRFNSIWIVLVGVIVSVTGLVFAPQHRSLFMIVLVMGGVILSLNMLMWFRNLMNPPPVPNQAVRLLLKRCMDGQDLNEWFIAEFAPAVSLEEARFNVGNDNYSQEDRVNSFMMKFKMLASSRPETAIFYSINRGVVVAKVGSVRSLIKKYGMWKLDTWYCLVGALSQKNLEADSLDGSQTVW